DAEFDEVEGHGAIIARRRGAQSGAWPPCPQPRAGDSIHTQSCFYKLAICCLGLLHFFRELAFAFWNLHLLFRIRTFQWVRRREPRKSDFRADGPTFGEP